MGVAVQSTNRGCIVRLLVTPSSVFVSVFLVFLVVQMNFSDIAGGNAFQAANKPDSDFDCQKYLDNPWSMPSELIVAALNRLLDIDANQLDGELRKILEEVGISKGTGRFLMDTVVRSWVSERMGGIIVDASAISLSTRDTRAKVSQQSYLSNLAGAISGRSVLTQTKILQEAEQVAAETLVARAEVKRLAYEVAKLERELVDIPRKRREEGEQIIINAQSEAVKIMEEARIAAERAVAKAQEALAKCNADQHKLVNEIARLRAAKQELLDESPELAAYLESEQPLKQKMFYHRDRDSLEDTIRRTIGAVDGWLKKHGNEITDVTVQYEAGRNADQLFCCGFVTYREYGHDSPGNG